MRTETAWKDITTDWDYLEQHANGYIRYADHTYRNDGEISASSSNALLIYRVQPGQVIKVSLQMLTRFRIGALPELITMSECVDLFIDEDDTNGTTVINQPKEHEYTVPDGCYYLLIGYWSGSAGQWTSTFETVSVILKDDIVYNTITVVDGKGNVIEGPIEFVGIPPDIDFPELTRPWYTFVKWEYQYDQYGDITAVPKFEPYNALTVVSAVVSSDTITVTCSDGSTIIHRYTKNEIGQITSIVRES